MRFEDRDAGLQLAITSAGGLSALARKLDMKPNYLGWTRVPPGWLFAVAKASGVDPEKIRPDLAVWIAEEKRRQWMARARERHSLVLAATGRRKMAIVGPEQELVDMLVAMAAMRYAAEASGLRIPEIVHGRKRPQMAARSWAMALAHVVGRASTTAIGALYTTSRQNADNACERYLRARDGDDPEDFLQDVDGPARVMERGRSRPVKTGNRDLVAHEQRFLALIQKPADQWKDAA
jgi:hypothetical protein